jgi:hypothetical protein
MALLHPADAAAAAPALEAPPLEADETRDEFKLGFEGDLNKLDVCEGDCAMEPL